MKVADFIHKVMETHELPEFDSLRPDFETCTIELKTREGEVFIMTIVKKRRNWGDE